MKKNKNTIYLVGEDLKKNHYARLKNDELVEVPLEKVLEKPVNFDEWINQVKHIFDYNGYWIKAMQCTNYANLSNNKLRYKLGKTPSQATKMKHIG